MVAPPDPGLTPPLQVRDYYYRLQKRLNRLLAKELQFDGKSPAPLHQAMLKFWEVVRSSRQGAGRRTVEGPRSRVAAMRGGGAGGTAR